jgi:hypothetical protein
MPATKFLLHGLHTTCFILDCLLVIEDVVDGRKCAADVGVATLVVSEAVVL